jgi:hypothetical protein
MVPEAQRHTVVSILHFFKYDPRYAGQALGGVFPRLDASVRLAGGPLKPFFGLSGDVFKVR